MAIAPHYFLVEMVETFWNFPSIPLGQQFVKQNCPTTRLCAPAESKIFSPLPASRVFEPNRRYEVLEKTISRIRIVLLLWETNKRLKRARFNSKQAIKNRSIFCSAMFVLIFGFGARACYSTTWYSWRHRPHFYPDPAVHTSTKDIRIRFYPLSRAFPNLYEFGGSDPRVSVDGRPKRIKKYTDSNESARAALVWTGPNSAKDTPFQTRRP